ncbi:MAG: phosphopyruvate hydratase [Bacteroidetes bacterium]|nr:phosphopyruvate hydratase [Bacteroidota bacterium]
MDKIKDIKARQILDSRGNPTIEVEIINTNNISALASVPSGASTGKHEALELRDNDYSKYSGKSVFKAIANVQNLKKELIGMQAQEQQRIDLKMLELDGTPNKSKLGANAILGISLALAKLGAKEQNKELYEYLGSSNSKILPMPLINIINGGAHADNNIDIQEFMIIPIGAKSFSEAIKIGTEIFHTLGKILKKDNYNTNVGDEGGYAPNLKSDEQAIEYILESINKAGYKVGGEVAIAIDAAATEFYDITSKKYKLLNYNKKLSSEEMVDFWTSWINKYPIISLEDPLSEDDWEGWSKLTEKVGDKIQIIGDDLFTTNIDRLEKGINLKAANAILIKMNQIGTISETLEVINKAKENKFNIIISHRSGETEDTSIADLAIACSSKQIKTGSLSRSERVAKYNRLLRIEEKLDKKALFYNPFDILNIPQNAEMN